MGSRPSLNWDDWPEDWPVAEDPGWVTIPLEPRAPTTGERTPYVRWKGGGIWGEDGAKRNWETIPTPCKGKKLG